MMIKIENLMQTHEVVRVFGFEPYFFQSTLGGFETGKKGVNQGLNGRDGAGLFMSGACLSRR